GRRPKAYTPYEAALSDEPCPTIRTVVASRRCISSATRAKSASCSSSRSSASGCSRISARNRAPGCSGGGSASTASGNDTFLPADEHPVDLEVVVDDDDVGRRSGREIPRLQKAERA